MSLWADGLTTRLPTLAGLVAADDIRKPPDEKQRPAMELSITVRGVEELTEAGNRIADSLSSLNETVAAMPPQGADSLAAAIREAAQSAASPAELVASIRELVGAIPAAQAPIVQTAPAAPVPMTMLIERDKKGRIERVRLVPMVPDQQV
jgi:hypothetical protein